MWYYLPLVFIPSLLVVLAAKWIFKHHISYKEWMFQGGGLILSTLMCLLILAAAGAGMSRDFNIINGQVVSKAPVKVSCEHQYKCGETCHNESTTDSKGNVSVRRVCIPIYCDEHDYDIDWDVKTTVGTYTIDRVNRQGTKEPPRWSKVEIGEPVSRMTSVLNYLLLDSTRFKTSEAITERYKDRLLRYPTPTDYYRINRVVSDHGGDYKEINKWLNNALRLTGPKKQLNIVLVVTRTEPEFFYAQMQAWNGTRKNDVVIFYGTKIDGSIRWAKAMAFADGQNNQIMLKELESLTYNKTFNLDLVKEQFALINKDFNRIPNSNFAYLKEGYVPPFWLAMTVMIFNFLVTCGITFFFIREDI